MRRYVWGEFCASTEKREDFHRLATVDAQICVGETLRIYANTRRFSSFGHRLFGLQSFLPHMQQPQRLQRRQLFQLRRSDFIQERMLLQTEQRELPMSSRPIDGA